MDEISTQDRIIAATIELVTEKGFKGATTRAIAAKAGVNEVTLFRHFGSKKGIVEAAINKYSFMEYLSETIQNEMIWDIEADLRTIAKQYQQQLNKNREIILISFREVGAFPELDEMIARVPIQFKEELMSYLKEMIKKGKIVDTDVEMVAIHFMVTNFGYFFLQSRLGSNLTAEDYLERTVDLLAKSLLPS